jgi:hypothetical protein
MANFTESDINGIMVTNGYEEAHTGGNCRAWVRMVEDRKTGILSRLTITDGDCGLYEDPNEPVWFLGEEGPDSGDWLRYHEGLKLEQALAIATQWAAGLRRNHYRPMLRPAGKATLPEGVTWSYVEQPAMHGLVMGRPGLPVSKFTYGIIQTSRPLTLLEAEHFDLRPV